MTSSFLLTAHTIVSVLALTLLYILIFTLKIVYENWNNGLIVQTDSPPIQTVHGPFTIYPDALTDRSIGLVQTNSPRFMVQPLVGYLRRDGSCCCARLRAVGLQSLDVPEDQNGSEGLHHQRVVSSSMKSYQIEEKLCLTLR